MSTDFLFSWPIEVRFRDIDSFGHVNNAVYLSYFEQARILYLQALGLREKVPTTILVRNVVDYRHPVFLGDAVRVGVRVTRVGTKSLEFAYELHANDRLCTQAVSVHVWYDLERQIGVPVPDEARAKIAAFEGWDLDS